MATRNGYVVVSVDDDGVPVFADRVLSNVRLSLPNSWTRPNLALACVLRHLQEDASAALKEHVYAYPNPYTEKWTWRTVKGASDHILYSCEAEALIAALLSPL